MNFYLLYFVCVWQKISKLNNVQDASIIWRLNEIFKHFSSFSRFHWPQYVILFTNVNEHAEIAERMVGKKTTLTVSISRPYMKNYGSLLRSPRIKYIRVNSENNMKYEMEMIFTINWLVHWAICVKSVFNAIEQWINNKYTWWLIQCTGTSKVTIFFVTVVCC